MEGGEEKKGFTIRDRRVSSHPEEAAKGESGKAEEMAEGHEGERSGRKPEPRPLPEIDFSAFIFSLSTSALLHLGEVPDPVTQKREKDLPLAKQTIDILGMLKEKTRGNLTSDEEKLMENLLTDLRWRYVRDVKG
jgi:Domain of unknown function (DUF1844)